MAKENANEILEQLRVALEKMGNTKPVPPCCDFGRSINVRNDLENRAPKLAEKLLTNADPKTLILLETLIDRMELEYCNDPRFRRVVSKIRRLTQDHVDIEVSSYAF